MKWICPLSASVLVPLLCLVSPTFRAGASPELDPAIRVLLVTGGHPFEKEPFFKLFADNPDITVKAVEPPDAYAFLRPEAAKDFDVMILYDYNQPIPAQARADFLAWLKAGKGLLVLHHAIAAHPDWPEYANIIGAHYYLKKTATHPRSAFKEGLQFKIHVVNPENPVTRGLMDFEIQDETYRLYDLDKDCHPLLTTPELTSNPEIAWARTYKKARVVYIQSGHGPTAYENVNYQLLVRMAIQWVGRRN